MVNLTVKQVETLCIFLEDIDPKLKVLGLVDRGGSITYNDSKDLTR